MNLEDLANANEYIIHELVKFMDPRSLRHLRAVCKRMEQILSSNSKFVGKAFLNNILSRLGDRDQSVPFDTYHLRLFIANKMEDAQEGYKFARDIIRVSEHTRHEWNRYRKYVTKWTARNALRETRAHIKRNWEKFDQILQLDETFDIVCDRYFIISIYNNLTALNYELKREEGFLTKMIIEKQGIYTAFDENEIMKQKHIIELRYRGFYSANIIQFLLAELLKIQIKHLERLKSELTSNN